MQITYQNGTTAPENNGVYLLANGLFARFENGCWFKHSEKYEQALVTTCFAGFISPKYRTGRHHRWTQVIFVLFDPVEHEFNGHRFWSNEYGWSSIEHATTYNVEHINQPVMRGHKFIPLVEALTKAKIV